ncbi:16S rRNA (adenine(1518)-N(6)/adenine(1519)-N(6))-dimethyltransferase RsmA [Buchnera aphidicola]|uniref:16S rRNA (adenine(1518)-N(6)/adenine(1519)-N(6))- dimethyltransferase RsmA n=1 Tax=Buchnera aphidicola TaxID=9 RepID=UPI00094DD59A|nr:16S rRNA (adenine(1518)-N(6)/adenine(1519)-N(6))-dimethyltransferase RsmA [Buchnera aphidicola]
MNFKKSYLYSPNKKLGQNFLISKNIINAITTILNVQYYDRILEIGPGLGAITYPVSQIVKELIILEIDEKLIPILCQYSFKNRVRIILANAMTFDYSLFFNKYNTNTDTKFLRFFGNLPYNIATEFLLYLLSYKIKIYDMHFMFQKEVALRILAQPNKKKYGRLSIIVQFFFHVKSMLSVSKFYFFPIPKVDSVFLKFSPINNQVYKYDIKKYILAITYITQIAFQHRRKILKNSLCRLFHREELSCFGINIFQRAENISVEQYFKLTEYYIKKMEKN